MVAVFGVFTADVSEAVSKHSLPNIVESQVFCLKAQ